MSVLLLLPSAPPESSSPISVYEICSHPSRSRCCPLWATLPPYLTLPILPQTHTCLGLSFLFAPLIRHWLLWDVIISQHVLSPDWITADVTFYPSVSLPGPSTGLHTAGTQHSLTGRKGPRRQAPTPPLPALLILGSPIYYRTSCPSILNSAPGTPGRENEDSCPGVS